jgi:hypothetical protein
MVRDVLRWLNCPLPFRRTLIAHDLRSARLLPRNRKIVIERSTATIRWGRFDARRRSLTFVPFTKFASEATQEQDSRLLGSSQRRRSLLGRYHRAAHCGFSATLRHNLHTVKPESSTAASQPVEFRGL